jgi:antitoxin ParD1/3/4
MAVNVNLTPELEALVRDKIASGRYQSESEVVCDALRLMEARDQEYQSKLEWLRREVQAGIDSGTLPGDLDVEDIKRRGRERLEQLRKR